MRNKVTQTKIAASKHEFVFCFEDAYFLYRNRKPQTQEAIPQSKLMLFILLFKTTKSMQRIKENL
jgi:hypothetical protein